MFGGVRDPLDLIREGLAALREEALGVQTPTKFNRISMASAKAGISAGVADGITKTQAGSFSADVMARRAFGANTGPEATTAKNTTKIAQQMEVLNRNVQNIGIEFG